MLAGAEDALAFSPGAGVRTSVVRTDSGVDTTVDVVAVELFTVFAPAVDLTLDLPGVTSIQNFATPSSLVMRTGNADETWTVNATSLQRTIGGAFNYQATLGSLISMDLDFGGGNDTATMTAGGVSRTLRGGAGSDAITGSTGAETLEGDAGNDTLNGGAGVDTVRGGSDDDTLKGGAGNDALDGGGGIDTADFSDATAAIDFDVTAGQANANGVDTLTSVEGAIGGPFGDHFTGDAGPNRFVGGGGGDKLEGNGGPDLLDGGAGNDELYGGAGADTAMGGAGDDFLRMRDGAAVDSSSCGADLDRVEVDAGEIAGADCELVDAPSGPGSQGPAGQNGTNGSNGTQGPAGGTGATGATGAAGPQGPRGPAGRDARVTCTPGKPTGKAPKIKVAVTCKVTLAAAKATTVRARLERGGRTYASGVPVRRGGRLSLRFSSAKKLRPGRYTLVVNERTAAGRTITRFAVTL
jgi:Ca2+-binding RTX toxin-like protein